MNEQRPKGPIVNLCCWKIKNESDYIFCMLCTKFALSKGELLDGKSKAEYIIYQFVAVS